MKHKEGISWETRFQLKTEVQTTLAAVLAPSTSQKLTSTVCIAIHEGKQIYPLKKAKLIKT